ncbi:MAG: T9SS type A sorting domain-containing protein [Crocinitomicaceae bacterium]|nr:T9SS type A sorting domain-containing protein [Crocinitomicaceae bacterium]
MNKFLYVLLSLFYITYSQAQTLVDEDFFYDSLAGDLTNIIDVLEVENGFIVAGWFEGNSGINEGVVLRLNQIGEVVWSTVDNSEQISCYLVSQVELFSDGFVYAYGCEQIWKINATSGTSEWITSIDYDSAIGFTNNSIEIEEYDSTRFIISYGDFSDYHYLAFLNKSTGDSLISYEMGYGNNTEPELAVDPYGNVLYGIRNTLYKLNGDRLNQRVWKKRFNLDLNDPDKIDEITELYCDAHGDIFVFGYDVDFGTELILAKTSSVDGSIIWKTEISGNNSLRDFKDQFGYLYMTYQYKYVGAGSSFYSSSKINKETGLEEWYSNQNMTSLTVGVCNSKESAKVLDIDCEGNAYLNGVYGGFDYGPSIWGLMKIHSQDGTKDFDITITQDSLNCDNGSIGRGVAVINNVPIFVGNEEVGPLDVKATFIALDTVTGLPSIRHHIGLDHQHFSSTVDIQNSNDSMFLLLQKGDMAVLQMRKDFGVSEWEFADTSSGKTKAGCISINENSAYLAINRLDYINVSPSNYDSTTAILFFKLDPSNGSVLQQDSLFITGDIELIEMESDSTGQAFLLYSDGVNMNIIRWNLSGLSSSTIISSTSANTISGRPLDLLNNYSNNEILFAGVQDLFSINKSTLTPTSIYSYPTARNVYDIINEGGAIVLCGDNGSSYQSMISIDSSNYSLNWDQTYQSGSFGGVLYQLDTLYTYGNVNGQMQVQSIIASNGTSEWEYLRPNISASNATAYDLLYSSIENRFVLSGIEDHMDGSSDIAIDGIEIGGNGNSLLFISDGLGYQSKAFCSSVQFDSLAWVGGSVNGGVYGKQGANYLIQFYECPNLNSVDHITACDSYTWMDGITYTSSNSSATWSITNSSGCDSIVTLDLILGNTESVTDVQYACEELIWIDGNSYTSNNSSATWMLTSSLGCDSLITLDLTIGEVNVDVTNNSPILISNDVGANYQWIDCDNNNLIVGETNQSYTAELNGNYAVIITDGNCIDTSACFNVANLDTDLVGANNDMSIFPNPMKNELNIQLNAVYSNVDIEVRSLIGSLVFNKSYHSIDKLKLDLECSKGVYLLNIQLDGKESSYRIVKQ